MFSMVYVSSAAQLLTQAQLDELLSKSRENNARLGITGMLLYRDGNIMQLLEGDEPSVRGLYQRIAADPRHHTCQVLLTSDSQDRMFPDWSMAFRRLEAAPLEGFSEFLNARSASPPDFQDPSHAQRLLLLFRQMMR